MRKKIKSFGAGLREILRRHQPFFAMLHRGFLDFGEGMDRRLRATD